MCVDIAPQDCDSYTSRKQALLDEMDDMFTTLVRTNARLSEEQCEATWAVAAASMESNMRMVRCYSGIAAAVSAV